MQLSFISIFVFIFILIFHLMMIRPAISILLAKLWVSGFFVNALLYLFVSYAHAWVCIFVHVRQSCCLSVENENSNKIESPFERSTMWNWYVGNNDSMVLCTVAIFNYSDKLFAYFIIHFKTKHKLKIEKKKNQRENPLKLLFDLYLISYAEHIRVLCDLMWSAELNFT